MVQRCVKTSPAVDEARGMLCCECLFCLPAAVLQQPLATEVSDGVALVARLVLEVRQLLLHVPTAGSRLVAVGLRSSNLTCRTTRRQRRKRNAAFLRQGPQRCS